MDSLGPVSEANQVSGGGSPKRTRRSRGGPLTRERAYALLFRQETVALVRRWLECLAVPLRDREDVAQDVFLAASRSFPTYNPLLSRPERWLNRITVHVAAHYWARALHRREELTADEPLDLVDEGPGPEQQLDHHRTRALVMAQLLDLDIETRSVLVAYEIDEIPMVEVATLVSVPLSTAYKWRARGLASLRASSLGS